MYKVGIMMMGKQSVSQKKVKEVILEVQAKTKITNIFEYLIELKKIPDMNVSIALKIDGQRINETATISQVLKYTRPSNGVIKLYLYDQDPAQYDNSTQAIKLKSSRQKISDSSFIKNNGDTSPKKSLKKVGSQNKQQQKNDQQQSREGFCCC